MHKNLNKGLIQVNLVQLRNDINNKGYFQPTKSNLKLNIATRYNL